MGKKACGVPLAGGAHGRMQEEVPTLGLEGGVEHTGGCLCTVSPVLGPVRISFLEIVRTWWIGLETHSSGC